MQRRTWTAIAVMMILASSCSTDSPYSSDPTWDSELPDNASEFQVDAYGHVLSFFAVESHDFGHDDALFSGRLFVAEGCALFEFSDEMVVIVYWPFGARRVGETKVEMANGSTLDVALGHTIKMGGGVGEIERGLNMGHPDYEECVERTDATGFLSYSGSPD